MGLFDDETRSALMEIFSRFPRTLTDYLVVSRIGCATCGEAERLARELMEVSGNKLVFKIIDFGSDEARVLNVRYVPAFIYDTPRKNIRYYGLPSGQEFAPFIYVHEYIATGRVKLPSHIIEEVRSIKTPMHIKVFVTPECPYCPIAVDTLNQMGLVNDKLLIETIESMELPEEANMYGVMYVPAIIISDVERLDGYVTPDIILEALKRAEEKLSGTHH